MLYAVHGVRAYFDSYGIREWERLERTLQRRRFLRLPPVRRLWPNRPNSR